MLDDFILEQQCDEFDNDWFGESNLSDEWFEGGVKDGCEENDWLDVLPF